jgi:Domain of unknown function (DUF5606)
MKLKEIATISGKPGLFKVFKPTKNGVIVESLDDKKAKMVAGASHRVSILQEVSIYTTTNEESVALAQVLDIIHQQYPDGIELNAQSSDADFKTFLEQIVPDYDRSKVYASDMRKLVNWYNIILKYTPETLTTLLDVEEEVKPEETETKEATPTEVVVVAEPSTEVNVASEVEETNKKTAKKNKVEKTDSTEIESKKPAKKKTE